MPWWGFVLLMVGGMLVGLSIGVTLLRYYFRDMM
jgi:hypothetical protein